MGITRRIALVVGSVLVLSACRNTPEPVPAVPVLPLEQADWAIFWNDFDRRLDHALAQGLVPPYDAGPIATYAGGPELAVGQFNVALNQASGWVEPAGSVQHAGVSVYTGLFADYPMWLMAGASAVTRGATGAGPNYAGISVFTKAASDAPWLVVTHVPLEVARMPAATGAPTGIPAEDSTATAADTAHADAVAAELIDYWQDGAEPTEVRVGSELRAITAGLTTSTIKDVARAYLTVEPYPDVATYTVHVKGASLAMLTFRATAHYEARPGHRLAWSGPRAALYGAKRQPALLVGYAFTTLVSLPENGSPATVLSTGMPEILMRGRPTV